MLKFLHIEKMCAALQIQFEEIDSRRIVYMEKDSDFKVNFSDT